MNKKEKITTKNIGRTKRKTHSTPKPQKPRNENAIKHNVISDKQPLTINITSDLEKRKLIICIKIQPKIDKSAGNGIGLANLSERYRLKWNTDIEIFNNNVDFCVAIKLNKIN